MGLSGSLNLSAKEITIPTPKFSVKMVNNGTAVKITISKTKDADGFEISWKYNGNPYAKSLYKLYDKVYWYGPYANMTSYDPEYVEYPVFYYDDYFNDSVVTNPYNLEKNGKAKRTVTIKNLQPGKYEFVVRSWNNTKFGTKVFSKYGKYKTIELSGVKNKNGYKSSYDFSKVKKGDVIKFGAYEQDRDYTNGKEPIEWIVLEKTKKQLFVVSKYVLEDLPYFKDEIDSYEKVTWENCTLRKWLNNAFFDNAFNKSEQSMIKATKIDNYDNVLTGTSGGKDTKDKIFLLSQLDIINPDYGFSEKYDDRDKGRLCTLYWLGSRLTEDEYRQKLINEQYDKLYNKYYEETYNELRSQVLDDSCINISDEEYGYEPVFDWDTEDPQYEPYIQREINSRLDDEIEKKINKDIEAMVKQELENKNIIKTRTNHEWGLRTPSENYTFCSVNTTGSLTNRYINYDRCGIRPAMYISIK